MTRKGQNLFSIRYYDRMSEEDKALLPIIPVYFLKA